MSKYVRYGGLWMGIIVFLGFAGNALAQEIRITATVDQTILTLNDQLQLTITIHGTQDSSPPSFPDIDGFQLLFGPKISTQTSIVNGAVSMSKGYSYVLQPKDVGKFTIGPSTLKYKGKEYSSSPLPVEVVPTRRSTGSRSPDLEKLIFVELSAHKKEVYVYEQTVLSFKLYFQKGLPISGIDYVAPATKNFMEERLGEQRQYEEVREGIIYNVLELRTALFPIVSGELTISPAKLQCDLIIRQHRGRRSSNYGGFFEDSFFDDFFSNEQKRYPIERVTNSIDLTVKPLPEQGKPESFHGAVGSFNMEASVKTQQMKVGDPITISMSVYGDGNIQTISEPVLMVNNEGDFKIYPAESNTQITHREEVIRGRKVFSKVIEPQKTDITHTPAIVFSYFDPETEQYRSITKEPIPINVEAWDHEIPIQLAASQDQAPSGKQQVKILTKDIMPIMTSLSSLQNQGRPLYGNPLTLAYVSIPAIAVIASFFIARQKERLQTDIGYARNKRAHATAKKRLSAARSALSHKNPAEFYSSLSRAISDYLADKCNLSSAQISGEQVGVLLEQQGVGDSVAEEVSGCLKNFDYRRFSRDAGTKEEMEHSFQLAEQLITKLERQLS
ncbi:MAG: BatD family protein [Candidatus Brocadiaceae bacterium]|nr:BatD family protein [Candidatus Brocadiaceae bacterium]